MTDESDDLTRVQAILRDLVAFPTLSGQNNRDVVDYIVAELERAGVRSHLDPCPEGRRYNLFATVGPEIDGGVMLCAHLDVVPAGAEGWAGDPFELRRDQTRLHGRGAVDMKGFVASVLAMIPHFQACAERLSLPIHLGLTFDEEEGCFGAAQFGAFLDRLGIHPAIAIIGEPTGMMPITGHKAIHELTTTVRGSSGHASDPRGRVNAIAYASRLIDRISELARAQAAAPKPGVPFDPPYTTVSVGAVQGGEARNIIPNHCQFDWEVRPLPGEDGEELVNYVRALASCVLEPEMQSIDPRAGIEIDEIAFCPGLAFGSDTPALELIRAIWTDAAPQTCTFGTDGGHLQAAGMDVVVIGPGQMSQMHQPDEYIELSELADGLEFLHRLCRHLEKKEQEPRRAETLALSRS